MPLSFDPAVILLLALAEGLWLRAAATLARRGQRIGAGQRAAWHAGIALTAIALLGPFDQLGEELLSAHMAQHLLVADLAAPLLLAGLRNPLLAFYLPRPVLVPLSRSWLRRAAAPLRKPLVAIAVYVGVLYAWHVVPLFEGALRNDLLHALQHESFVASSALVWWVALDPGRRRLRGELWKIGHVIGARFAGMFLGMAFLALRSPIYEGYYGESAREHGLTPLADQQIAGGMMLALDAAIMLFALGFFFFHAGREHDRAERAERAEREREERADAAAVGR